MRLEPASCIMEVTVPMIWGQPDFQMKMELLRAISLFEEEAQLATISSQAHQSLDDSDVIMVESHSSSQAQAKHSRTDPAAKASRAVKAVEEEKEQPSPAKRQRKAPTVPTPVPTPVPTAAKKQLSKQEKLREQIEQVAKLQAIARQHSDVKKAEKAAEKAADKAAAAVEKKKTVEKKTATPAKTPAAKKAGSKPSEVEEEWEVECITTHNQDRYGVLKFQVHWKGSDEVTWQTVPDLKNATLALDEYLKAIQMELKVEGSGRQLSYKLIPWVKQKINGEEKKKKEKQQEEEKKKKEEEDKKKKQT